MSRWYILDGHNVVPASVDRASLEKAIRTPVAKTDLNGSHISTVFLSLDHRHFGEGPPLVFETLVIGGKLADEMYRYSTWEEAETGHAAMVNRVRNAE